VSQNYNFAYHIKYDMIFKKEKSYLAWYHPTTSQCRLT